MAHSSRVAAAHSPKFGPIPRFVFRCWPGRRSLREQALEGAQQPPAASSHQSPQSHSLRASNPDSPSGHPAVTERTFVDLVTFILLSSLQQRQLQPRRWRSCCYRRQMTACCAPARGFLPSASRFAFSLSGRRVPPSNNAPHPFPPSTHHISLPNPKLSACSAPASALPLLLLTASACLASLRTSSQAPRALQRLVQCPAFPIQLKPI